MRVLLAGTLMLISVSLAGCAGGDDYPPAAQKLVVRLAESGVCEEMVAEDPGEDSKATHVWSCDGGAAGMRLASYESVKDAATWVAQSQLMSLCARTNQPLNVAGVEYGELLLGNAALLGDLDTLKRLREGTSGWVYDRNEPFPGDADPLLVEPVTGCGEVDVLYPDRWEQYRRAYVMLP